MAFEDVWKKISWLYYQYILVTALYMLEPWERAIFNSILISVAGMAVYTGYVFMPQHIMAILQYFEMVQWHELYPSLGVPVTAVTMELEWILILILWLSPGPGGQTGRERTRISFHFLELFFSVLVIMETWTVFLDRVGGEYREESTGTSDVLGH